MTISAAPEPPEHAAWRAEFMSWPESKLRMFSEPSTTSLGYDERKAFARSLLAELAEAKRDAREEITLEIAQRAAAASERANELASEANSDARKARSTARCANIIAISAAAL